MKLMFVVRGDTRPLRDPALHARLADAGVHRWQVNLDDEDVAGALRLQAGAEPVRGLASAWTSSDPAPVVAVVTGALPGAAAYEVEERRPLDPPELEDGSRAEALANVALLRRPDELVREEWLARWLGPHTQVAIETQATFGYLQNVVVAALTPDAPRVDAIVEELFPPEAVSDVHAFYGSGGDDAELTRRITRLMESVASIGADRDLDLVPSSRFVYAL